MSNSVTKGGVVDADSAILEDEIRGQGVFVSSFTHSLDPKKRLTIPSQWRAQVGVPKSLYVLPDIQHPCLCVFPAGEIAQRLRKMRDYSMADEKARSFARTLASRSDLVAWDSQGRIRVKDELLKFADLKDQVTLVGAFDRFELWNPQALKRTEENGGGSLKEAALYVGM
jgi:MraZ protein